MSVSENLYELVHTLAYKHYDNIVFDINNSNKIFKDKSRMKVHHILSETLDVKQIDGMWRVFDTVKNSVLGDIGFSSPGEAEAERDKIRSNRAKTSGRRPAPVATRGGTPTATVPAPDVLTPDADEIKTTSDKPKQKKVWGIKSNLGKGFKKDSITRALSYGKSAFGGSVIGIGLKLYQISSIVDMTNVYDRQIDEISRLYAANRSDPKVEELYTQNGILVKDIIDKTTDYIFTSIGLGIGTAVAAGSAAIVGPGWVVALLAGAALGAGGAAGFIAFAKYTPVDWFFDDWISKDPDATIYDEAQARIAKVIFDNIQDSVRNDGASFWSKVISTRAYPAILNLQALQFAAIPVPVMAPALAAMDKIKGVFDSVTYEDKETADTSFNDMKQFVLKDPKLKKLVVQGAAEIKRQKSNGPR